MPSFLDDYEPVEDRLAKFWTDWPDGRVVTVLITHADGHYIVRAEVFCSADGLPTASGLAEEREGSTVVNKTSALENCETSAIGRALANLGYAAKGKRASREEMSKTSPAAGPHSGVATKGEDGDHGKPASASSPAGDTSSGAAQSRAIGRQAPDTSSAEGEAAGVEPGEGQSKPSPGFPIDPAKCDHKMANGHWVKWRIISVNVTSHGDATPRFLENEVCPKCGTPKLVAMEGTTADLGPA